MTDVKLAELVAGLDDATLYAAIRNLGGHDLAALREAFDAIDDTRPTVIFAYTVKGYGLATEGHPQNHSSLLTVEQMGELAEQVGASTEQPWARFPASSAAAALCRDTAERLRRQPVTPHSVPELPTDIGRTPGGHATTQAALGRTLLDLTRAAPDAAKRVVTLAPDVSSSTNLGGWVNKVGVWSARERVDWFADDPETILHWRERPTASTWSWASPRPTWSASSASWAPPGAGGASRCCRSGCSTTRSSNARWSRGRSGSTRAASRSSSAPRPG